MMTALIPVILMLVGAAFYVFSQNSKLAEIGRLLFAAGAFALAFTLASQKLSNLI